MNGLSSIWEISLQSFARRGHFCNRIFLVVLASSLVLLFPNRAKAGGVELNGSLQTDGSSVSNFVNISPDGKWAAYVANQDTFNADELYGVNLDFTNAPTATKLHTNLAGGSNVRSGRFQFVITPDSSRVVYLANPSPPAVELFVTPLDADLTTNQTTLNGPLVAGGSVEEFQISPDGMWAVYLADQDTDFANELYKVRLDGTGREKLHPPLTVNRHVADDFKISADSQWVVFKAEQNEDNVLDSFSVRLDGTSGPIALNVNGVSVGQFQISPGSDWVVYMDKSNNNLFKVPIGGGAPLQLNDTSADGGNIRDFVFSLNNQWVVYENGNSELFSVSLAGGAVTKISGTNVNAAFRSFRISPDNNWVVYMDAEPAGGIFGQVNLFAVPLGIASPPFHKLNDTLVDKGESVDEAFQISQNNAWVVYRNVNGELFGTPLDGDNTTGPMKISKGTPVAGGEVSVDWQITPDSSQVVFRGDQDTDELREFYSAPLDDDPATEPVKLNSPLLNVRSPSFPPFEVTPDSTGVIYKDITAHNTVGQNSFSIQEIFLAATPDFAGTNVVQLTTGSPTSIRQVVDVPSNATNLEFDYDFLTPSGQLTVALVDEETGSAEKVIITPDPQQGRGILPIPQAFLGATGLTLTFTLLDVPTGTQAILQLNNVTLSSEFEGVFNGGFRAVDSERFPVGWDSPPEEKDRVVVITFDTGGPGGPSSSLDSFLCSEAKQLYLPRRYEHRKFGSITHLTLKSRRAEAESFCSTVNVSLTAGEGQDGGEPSNTSLTCYERKHWKYSRHFWRWWKYKMHKKHRLRSNYEELEVNNLFGSQILKVSQKPDSLCVQNWDNPEVEPSAPEELARFKCSKVKSKEFEGVEAVVEDDPDFSKTVKAVKAVAFCAAVDTEYQEIEEPTSTDHLTCYEVRVKKSHRHKHRKWRHWKHNRSSEKLAVSNDFGEEQNLKVFGIKTICVPPVEAGKDG